MFKHVITTASLLFSMLLTVNPSHLRAQAPVLSLDIPEIIEQSRADNAFWSVIVRDTTGKILEGFNIGKLVRPASNLKLLTSATVLNELGADYTYRTVMYGLGYQNGSSWEGNIIIRGSGDPSISGKYYNEDRFYVFNKFYKALKAMGIEEINGNLVGNDAFFDQQPYPKGWAWNDLSFYYGVETSALSFNNNTVDLTVYADGDIGDTPEIEWFPFDTDYVKFVNEQVISPAESEYDEFYRRLMGTNRIILRSKLPQNYVEHEALSVLNASRFFIDTFKKYLEDGNISVNGRLIVESQQQDWNSDQYKILAVHESVPLRKLLQQLNKESDNFYAEMLLKTSAAEHFDISGSTELGIMLMKDFSASIGLDTTKMELSDGSGMAASTLITVKNLSKLLVEMRDHHQFEVYKNSLSISGVDGSLEYRFPASMVGKIYGKTGYVSGVRSLSGYMESSSGKPLIFCVVANNYTKETSYIDYVQEKIIQKIYRSY
ncbi:MAG TPA: D-alanyl-D-alanine carboxypeptidase/D-alanyl-D-alanine-endopeptidase [Balneolaceae bacterium]